MARVFRKEWREQIQEIFENNEFLTNADRIPRVAKSLLNANPEAYVPQIVSLGPYYHWKFKSYSSPAGGSYQNREQKMSPVEACKIKFSTILWRKLIKSFSDIVQNIECFRPHFERFYDWPISEEGEYSKNFSLMMAIDSSFLFVFLFRLFSHELDDPSIDDDLIEFHLTIKCDILKLENQIPLPVLKGIFESVKEAKLFHEGHTDFKTLLANTFTELSPFDRTYDLDGHAAAAAEGEPHLLGCLHAFVSPFLDMQQPVQENDGQLKCKTPCGNAKHFLEAGVAAVCNFFPCGERDFHTGYNVAQLANAGIKFKPFSNELHQKIRFDKYSDTFYLPRITVSKMQTEVFFKNMVALEFNDVRRPNCVTRYVGLMRCLIHTPDDVRVLVNSLVIRRGSTMLTDQNVANMWDGMHSPFPIDGMEPPLELKEAFDKAIIKNFYPSKIKKMFSVDLSKNWKVIALLIAICFLALSTLRLYFKFAKLGPAAL